MKCVWMLNYPITEELLLRNILATNCRMSNLSSSKRQIYNVLFLRINFIMRDLVKRQYYGTEIDRSTSSEKLKIKFDSDLEFSLNTLFY